MLIKNYNNWTAGEIFLIELIYFKLHDRKTFVDFSDLLWSRWFSELLFIENLFK